MMEVTVFLKKTSKGYYLVDKVGAGQPLDLFYLHGSYPLALKHFVELLRTL